MKKILFAMLCFAVPAVASAGGNILPGKIGAAASTVRVGPAAITTQAVSFANAHQTKIYRVQCSNSAYLVARVKDCCIAGDKWEIEIDVKDRLPNKAVTMSSGSTAVFSPSATVRSFGKPLDALVKVSYPHGGVAIWPAGLTLQFKTNGTCIPVVTLLGTEYN